MITKHTLKRVLILGAVFSVVFPLGACSVFEEDDGPRLEGERTSVLDLQKDLEPEDAALEIQGLIAPAPWKNEFWPQAGGYPNHAMQNLLLSDESLKSLWSVSIGQGTTDELPLTAQPVVVDGRVFTMDTEASLAAFDAKNGKAIWRTNVADPAEDDPVIGGGIAYAGGVLYVTNGYDEILAVDPANGKILWRKAIAAPSRAAPTILNGRVFVTTLDNRLLALSASDGAPLWEHQGISEVTGLVGAASAAANNAIAVPVFSSGEITALRVENGSVAWTDNLSTLKGFGGLSGLSAIRALPVMDKGLVIAISFSGRLVAIDERTGARVWQREIGGTNTPWVSGNHIFVLTSDNQLVALGRDTGAIRWVFKIKESEPGESMFFSGPVLAGGRLILAGTGGRVLEVSPEDGTIIRQWRTDGSVMIAPVVAGGVLYLLSENGTLHAYQ